MDKDPLSLLAGDDSSSSEDENEIKNFKGKKSLQDISYYTSDDAQGTSAKLPSPSTLFSIVKRPDFLHTHSSDQVDWDSLARNIDTDAPPTSQSDQYNAVPPPPKHDDDVDPRAEISSDPVKYSVPSNADPKLLTVSSGGRSSNDTKRHANEEDLPSTKKSKGESFKEKEKRKRDLGMSSRGKSYVEEEKRILREQYSST